MIALGMALVVSVVSSAPAAATPTYPLAAAFGVKGRLLLADLHSRSVRELFLPGLPVVEADLERKGQLVAFTAIPENERWQQLFLLDLSSGTPQRVITGMKGHLRNPRFSHDGTELLFAAADIEGGETNEPTKLRSYNLKTKKTKNVGAKDALCEFTPTPLGPELLHVGTNCFFDFSIQAYNPRTGKTRTLTRASSSATEITSSFDEKTVLYTAHRDDGVGLWVIRPDASPAFLAALKTTEGRLQPHFVCPRDVMVFDGREVIVVNTKTGEAMPLVETKLDGGTP